MAHWLLMFRPETYGIVKQHGTIGVNANHHKRVGDIKTGDTFVTYISRTRILDGHGVFTSDAYGSENLIFGKSNIYPYRANVRFEQVGATKDAKELLWGLEQFVSAPPTTTPWNILMLKGGFLKITDEDHRWLRSVLDGSWEPGAVSSLPT